MASVITALGYDHMNLLGRTIQEIAAHKAGIIKVIAYLLVIYLSYLL